MKVLIAEDKLETIQSITDHCSDNSIEYQIIQDFNDVLSTLATTHFDALILDLKKDPGEEYPGYDIFNQIWAERFIPIIIYSSYYDNLPNKVDHQFVSYFDKSEEEKVIVRLTEYLSMSEKITKIRSKMNDLFIQALRFVNNNDSNDVQFQRVLIGMKNYLDEDNPNLSLPADVQYLVLPQYQSLATCDIVETIPQHNTESEFYMIMSPWCEIAQAGSPIELECKKIIDNSSVNSETRNTIKNHSNEGGYRNYILLPDCKKLKKKIVDVTKTVIIKNDQISLNPNETDLNRYKYRKIISIASPFRERMIALCYNNRSRIGVPNLNKDSWWIDEN